MQRKPIPPSSSSNRPPYSASNPPPPPPGRHPSYYRKRNLILFVVLSLLFLLSFGLSFIYTGTLTFGYYTHFKRNWGMKYFTPQQLQDYRGYNATGGDENGGPIYIVIKGHVIDVTTGKDYYGPGAGYSVFSGQDATRAFVTGCFRSGPTSDLRGLTEAQLKSIDEWLNFYLTHEKYVHIGYVIEDPIPEDAPLPDDNCNQPADA